MGYELHGVRKEKRKLFHQNTHMKILNEESNGEA